MGCGAIGTTVAAALARDGHDVLVADTNPEVVRHINAAGPRVQGPVEEFTAHPHAVLPAGWARKNLPDPGIVARNTRMPSVAAAHPPAALTESSARTASARSGSSPGRRV
jgi:NAD(P)-dependent dehydrogenase (short-subunit alcohol dehydrogenase family)